MIDVSATNASAGSISISASNGAVSFGGRLAGSATGNNSSGDFSVTAASMSSADFAALNALLTQGGLFDARSFDIKGGDLVIGDGVKAHSVTVSVDGGALTVAGTIDAGRRRARHDPPLGRQRLGACIDCRTRCPRHRCCKRIATASRSKAKNRGHIELTAAGGVLTLSPGATMDLTAPNGVAYGDVVLNAQRTGGILRRYRDQRRGSAQHQGRL